MDTTLVILLAVLACTFIGMIAAIIAATNRRGTRAPSTNLQPRPKGRLPVAFTTPQRDHGTQPVDTIEYRGVVILTRHVDMRLPISR